MYRVTRKASAPDYLNPVPSLSKQDNRMTASLRSMIGLFQKMFGDHFWENAVLEATHWNYHPHNTDLR